MTSPRDDLRSELYQDILAEIKDWDKRFDRPETIADGVFDLIATRIEQLTARRC